MPELHPAFPIQIGDGTVYVGLSAREYAAIHIAAGVMSNSENDCDDKTVAEIAVRYADTLFTALRG